MLRGLKNRGLKVAPELAVGDGALGFWGALSELYPGTKPQRCWVHKTRNVLNYLPKSMQPKAKAPLQELWMAETKAAADRAFHRFLETYAVKYPKATDCLAKDHDALLAFYDFPAEHGAHLRTTNPIESTFATIRHRANQTKGSVSRATLLALVYKLAMSAEKNFFKIRGFHRLAEVVAEVRFKDGFKQDEGAEKGVTVTTELQQDAARLTRVIHQI